MAPVFGHFTLVAFLVNLGLFLPDLLLLVAEGLEAFRDETGDVTAVVVIDKRNRRV